MELPQSLKRPSLGRSVSTLASATVVSRVLGLGRDVLLFAVLGAGPVSSAFVLAFTLPNLFRRLLGEGALTAALVPVLAQTLREEGSGAAHRLLRRVWTRLLAVTVALVLLGTLLVGAFLATSPVGRYALAGQYTAQLLPYLALICLAAAGVAGLQVRDRFAVAAWSPVALNVAMITALLAGLLGLQAPEARAWLLGWGVLFGGLLQCAAALWGLRQQGWAVGLDVRGDARLKRVLVLFGPAAAAAGVFQVNVVVARLLAFTVDEATAGILYLANRLVELPLGIFAIAVSTALFPRLSRLEDDAVGEQGQLYSGALQLIFAITVPAAAGLAVLAQPILTALFQWGLFSAEAVARCVPVLRLLCLGLPFWGWILWTTRAFQARQDTQTPFRLSLLNVGLNLIGSLVLLPWGAEGLALASVLAGIAHAVALEVVLRRRHAVPLRGLCGCLARIAGASALMALVLSLLASALPGLLPPGSSTRLEALVLVLVCVPAGLGVYALALWLSGVQRSLLQVLAR